MDKCGLYFVETDGRSRLMFNGSEIGSLRVRKTKTGIVVDGGSLKLYGVNFAGSSVEKPNVVEKDGDVYFGETLLCPQGKCINITSDDFSDLLAGKAVAGYPIYNPSAIYNIVDNVATSPEITYSLDGDTITFSTGVVGTKKKDMVYGNIDGVLSHNTEDITNTVTLKDTPFVCVKWFNQVVETGGHIDLTYHVDTDDMAKTNYDTVGTTFTVELTTEAGTTVKKTTFAGIFTITTPTFNTAGETWFSIRCIDDRGVSSPTIYFDVLVKNATTQKTYIMTVSDLETYQIVPNDSSSATALSNKAALSALFDSIKKDPEGYNSVLLYNNTNDNDGGGTVYWIDYHELGEPGYSIVGNRHYGGDDIVFPNNFTVDLNGATIAVTKCVDLTDGNILHLNRNIDTHITNGKIIGNYEGIDLSELQENGGGSGERLSALSTSAAHFCTFENLDVSYVIGYGCKIDEIYAGTYMTPEFSAGGINPSTGIVDVSIDGMVVSNLMTIKNDFLASGEISVGKLGRAGYWTYYNRQMFVSFYNSSDTHIKTVKTKMFYAVKIPANASKMRISGYGTVAQWAVVSEVGPLAVIHEFSKCIRIINCYFHDTRSSTAGAGASVGVSYENCTFKNIAVEEKYPLTPAIGDLEDGWQWLLMYQMKNCKSLGSPYDYDKLIVHYCSFFDFIGNENIRLSSKGGIQEGFISGNKMPELKLKRNWYCYNPHFILDDNVIGSLVIEEDDTTLPLVMSNTTIINKSLYNKLKLKNGTNGNDEYN